MPAASSRRRGGDHRYTATVPAAPTAAASARAAHHKLLHDVVSTYNAMSVAIESVQRRVRKYVQARCTTLYDKEKDTGGKTPEERRRQKACKSSCPRYHPGPAGGAGGAPRGVRQWNPCRTWAFHSNVAFVAGDSEQCCQPVFAPRATTTNCGQQDQGRGSDIRTGQKITKSLVA